MTEIMIRTSVDLAANADDAWRVFGEGFGEWAQWAPGIDKSTLQGPLVEGATRINETPTLGKVAQRLSRYQPDARALAYDMSSGLPPFLDSVHNDWSIEAVGADHCRLSGAARFVLKAAAAPKKPQIEVKMTQALDSFAAAFRETVEGKG
ncbi:MAG: hypothetical protein ACI9WU_001923 [Myxococcota bacterium]|jgi:hypothetical protein